jgi:O-antigen ligase
LFASGQRTVGVATIVAALVIVILHSALRARSIVNVITVTGTLVAAMIIAIISAGGILALIPGAFLSGDAASDLNLRFQIWTSIIASFNTWPLIAKILGLSDPWSLYWFLVQGGSISADARSAHNELFGALLFTGVLGIALIIGTVLTCMAEAMHKLKLAARNTSGLSSELILGFLVLLVIFGMSYEWAFEQGIILGLCIAGWSPQHRNSRSVKAFPHRLKGQFLSRV